jgi:signal transduction histidine kinase
MTFPMLLASIGLSGAYSIYTFFALVSIVFLVKMVRETKGLELGAVDYITKPFNFSVIRARIKTHLELDEARKKLKRQNEILRENLRLREQVEHITRHDLKNPLQVILNAAELLNIDPNMDAEVRNDLIIDQIESCYAMLNMINCSLELYKIENSSYVLDAKKIDVLPIIDRILFSARDMIQSMAITVRVALNRRPRRPGDTFSVFCDKDLFFSMVCNLVINAMEASPKGGIVDICLAAGETITLSVQNQGTVDFDIRDRFFEKYVTSGKPKGTGLGTYSARLIAEIHGGCINLSTSDEKHMTTVTIDLPNKVYEVL